MKILIFVICLIPAIARGADLWYQIDNAGDAVQKEMSARNAIADQSYFLGETLCYRYEFRKSKGLDVGNIAGENLFDMQALVTDQNLRDSLISWTILTLHSLESPWRDGESNGALTSISLWRHRLIEADGFKKAIDECSARIGQNIWPVLLKEMNFDEKAYSFVSAWVVPMGVGSKLLSFALRAPIWRATISWLDHIGYTNIRRTIAMSVGGIAVSGTIFVAAIRERRSRLELQNELSYETHTTSNSRDLPLLESDPWLIRNQAALIFASHYYAWAKTATPISTKLPESIAIELKQLLDIKPDLVRHENELKQKLAVLSQNKPAALISSLLNKQKSGVALSTDEQEILRKACVIGAIDLIVRLGDS